MAERVYAAAGFRGRFLEYTRRHFVDVHRLLAEESVDERMLEILARKASLFDEYLRRSDLKEATPGRFDISDLDQTREVAGQAELERRIVEGEQRRPGVPIPAA